MADAHPRLPAPIAQMAPWAFWSRIDLLGLPAEDVAAIEAGDVGRGTDDQVMRRYGAIESARSRLVSMPIDSTVPS